MSETRDANEIVDGRSLRARHVLLAVGASTGLLAFSLAVVGLLQGWTASLSTFRESAYLFVPVAVGFGVQIGLYSLLRDRTRARARESTAMAGAGGGTAAGAMIACCAHRIADLLPFLGLSAVTGLIASAKVPLGVVALAANLLGVALVVRKLVKKETA